MNDSGSHLALYTWSKRSKNIGQICLRCGAQCIPEPERDQAVLAL
jgi:hypothetical protein